MRLTANLGLAALLAVPNAWSAEEPPIGRARQQEVIDKALQQIGANYVYPDRAKAIEKALRENFRAGKYDGLNQLDGFLDSVNRDMQTVGNDKHLRVIHDARMAAQLRQEAAGSGEVSPQFLAMLKGSNFRLRKAESLDGNIGYFKFDNFVEPRFVREPFVGAMNMLHASAAFILDLSDNGGGASETADLLLSYFLPEGTRIGESWNRVTNKTTVSTVIRPPEVNPLLDIPVYVLVSERTASAAEAVAYSLQKAKRAVVVGAQTKGMANAGQFFLIDDRLFVMVPTILNRNAVSGTNWEGVGVTPDIVVARGKALEAAMAHALQRLAEVESAKTEKERLEFMAQGYAAAVSPESVPQDLLEACVGRYDGGQAVVQQHGLYFVSGDATRRMVYLGDRTFAVDGRPDYRLRFQAGQGPATELEVLWYDETSDTHPRLK